MKNDSRINQRTDIKILQNNALNKNGRLLSTEQEYKHSSYSKLKWQCEKGHEWEAVWHHIRKGSWCPICAKNKQRVNIKILQDYALNKNGKLLSEYKNNKTNLLWECSKKHQWQATWLSIKNGSWCPICYGTTKEQICRNILESKLNKKLSKHTFYYYQQRLEFDGYNEKAKIAFEYHGYQHYSFPNHFHKNYQDFFYSTRRDDLKEQYCAENNIVLIIIPYTENNNLEKYIDEQIEQHRNRT